MSASRAPSRRRSSRPAKADKQRALVRAILRLPPDPRDVFLLHRMAGMSYEEIGHQLGMEREAVLAHPGKHLSRSAARRGPPIPDMVASTDLRSGCRVWARLGARLSLRAAVRCVPERKNGLCGMRRVRPIMAVCRFQRIMNARHPPSRAVRDLPSATTCLGISPSPMKRSGSSTHGSAICWTSFGDWIPDWRTS